MKVMSRVGSQGTVMREPWVTGEGHQGSQVNLMRGVGVTGEGHEMSWGHR